jgi:hypothetical protein
VRVYGELNNGVACLFSNLGYGCVTEAHAVGNTYFEAIGPSNDVLPIGYWVDGHPPTAGPTSTVAVWALS